jgi:hypothetical protein
MTPLAKAVLREAAQQAALSAAPEPGSPLRWEARVESEDLDINLCLADKVLAWIELTADGWIGYLVGHPPYTPDAVAPPSFDPRVAMQSVLDAAKEDL